MEFIFCVTATRPTCSRPASISTRCSGCSDIVRSAPHNATSISWSGNASGEAAEITRLKKELRDAKEERDILEKALAYFADDLK